MINNIVAQNEYTCCGFNSNKDLPQGSDHNECSSRPGCGGSLVGIASHNLVVIGIFGIASAVAHCAGAVIAWILFSDWQQDRNGKHTRKGYRGGDNGKIDENEYEYGLDEDERAHMLPKKNPFP